MKDKIKTVSVPLACLMGSLCLLMAGCKEDKMGDTVPAPPRELAEKSLRMGHAPIAPPAAKSATTPPASR